MILDRKLNWNDHLEEKLRKYYAAFWLCRGTFGGGWGLKPRMMVWLYKAVLVPRVAYASVVWWLKTEQVSVFKKLAGLRGLVLRGAVGAMRTTPTASLGMLLGVPPLHLDIKGSKANSAYRLRSYGQWKPGTRHSKIPLLEEPILGMRTDFIPRSFQFGKNWTVTIPSREEWLHQRDSLPGHGDVWFTDGS